MSKDAYYFPHDSNAHKDPSILMLRVEYGWEGYGLYWAIIENLRDCSNYEMPLKAIGGLSLGLNYPIDRLNVFLEACYVLRLFTRNESHFWSDALTRRMADVDVLRQKFSDAGKAGAKKRWQGHSQANGHPIALKESKVKESKVNKKDVDTPKSRFLEFVLLTPGEYQGLIAILGVSKSKEYIQRLNNYIGSKKKKYPSHYYTILVWAKKDGLDVTLRGKPDPNCTICDGSGQLYAPGSGRSNFCKCTERK